MGKNILKNTSVNRKKTLFKALKVEKRHFRRVSAVHKIVVFFLLVSVVGSYSVSPAQSKKPLTVSFGREVTVNIFPGKVDIGDWSGVESVLIQDLSEGALYQDFSARNSAYVPLDDITISETKASSSSTSTLDSVATSSEKVVVPVETNVPAIEEGVTLPEEPVLLEVPAEEVGYLNISEVVLYQVSKLTSKAFPLAQAATTTAINENIEEVAVEAVPAMIELVEEVSEDQILVTTSTVETVSSDVAEETLVEEVVTEEETPVPTSVDISTSTTASDASLANPVDELVSASTSIETDEAVAPAEVVEELEVDGASSTKVTAGSVLTRASQVHEITLSDFDTPPLEKGQFVNGMQLRISLAAQLKQLATDNIPYVEVLFGKKNQQESIGIILVDDEVSNAINGGYFLFALPGINKVEQLKNTEVTLRYHGSEDLLNGMFLDSVWVEMDTKIVTKEDLEKRGVAENIKHLNTPKLNTLVSDKVNFRRDEAPLFNLRYDSQQNILTRGLRNLVGKDLVDVLEVNVTHNSFGLLGIKPEVTVTKEGLLTIDIPEEQLDNLRPGTYQVELVMNEGGKETVDTFSFQWGVLAINPDKSEYQVGELANISMGALSQNGHTVCDANLDLYVTDPDGFISRVEVLPSGECNGNNVIDVPDYTATASTTVGGTYSLYLERLDDSGQVMSFTNDTFLVTPKQNVSIRRNGPTRIYPPASYPMTLTVEANESFTGVLTERVPSTFKISSTTADITIKGEWQELTWDVSILGKGSKDFSYGFDAPDLSPYLYNLGPANLQGEAKQKTVSIASTTASTTEIKTMTEGGALFSEHRQWQIASDAVGNMILFFDGPSIPAGWTCLSCGSGTFFQRFVMGSSTYNSTGGVATHSHTITTSLLANTAATVEGGSGGPAINTHSHTLTPTISSESNLPEYRQLQVIQYTTAAGEPATIPAGAIAIFDVASSSLPVSWNRYAEQDGRYVYGENAIGTTGGSNTHAHTVSGTTGASTGGTARSRGGGSQTSAAADGHTHTISTSTETLSNEPPYVEVVLAQATVDVSPTNGIIAMWTEEVDSGWVDVSSDPGSAFSGRFLKASTTYGATGGGISHSHSDISNAQTSAPSATVNGRTGTSGSDPTHLHNVNFTSFSTESNLPPYLTAVFGKRQGTDPVYDQFSSLWYVNNNTATPTDPWPTGAADLAERAPITSADTPLKDGDVVRLRMNVNVTNATSTTGATFKLQYAAADTCSAASGWTDVGDAASTTVWRGYNNTGVADHYNLSTGLLGSTTVLATYEENGYATNTPSDISVDNYGEWDFVLQHNGAAAGTNYCFRMVENDGTAFLAYSHYPQLLTNEAPAAPVLEKLFDNEKTVSTTPWFYFYAVDPEGEKVHYQIQIDNNYDFSSAVIDRDTITESSFFENQVLISDKEPFSQGEEIRFIPTTALSNGSTYYWRVRAQDPDGSADWGDWSDIRSLTIDTTLTASAWFQTQDEQFNTNTLAGVEIGANQISLITGSTTGTTTSGTITFSDGDEGTAWGSLEFNDTETTGDIKYKLEYFDGTGWSLIPDGDLSGNSAGFDTSPVPLLNLDVTTYDQIRLVAVFTNIGGSPTLNDWAVNWGYRVETPTITKLFPNEQTGTTTPTFQFATTDPQSDSLTYQVQWSTTPDFVASTTRISDTNLGFTNLDAGGDTDPFNSGDDIQFTIQPADALTGTTTYWWRVRAKDTTGDNAWSFWTEEQSFTVIPGTNVSTWFQTTEEQFDTNILSGTVALISDSVAVATTATEAMVVYGEGTSYAPKYRQWDGTTLGSEGDMLDIGAPVAWAVVEAGTAREEYVAGTIGTDGDVNAQVFSTGVWDNLQELTITVGDINARGFDIAYETLSGDAMVAYCDGDADPGFAIWDGTSWTIDPTGINLNTTNNCEWVELESDPVSDEIIILSRDDVGSQYEAQVWNGAAWGNSTIQGGISDADHEGMALMYEESGGQALIVTSDGNPARFRWDSWNGTAWAGAGTQAIGDDFEWGQMARDVGSDEIILCYQDEDSDAGVVRWTGTAWAGQTELQINANAKNDPAFACVFEDTAARDNYIITTISDTAQTDYYTWNNTAWSGATQINTIGDTATAKLTRTGDAQILGTFFDDPTDALLFTTWNGSVWSTTQTIESDASVGTSPLGHPYDIASRNSGRDGTTIVSPGVNFDDGTGPYWQEFSWNDNQPGTSEILYHVQYYTSTSSWAFIPDSDLPGNVAGTSAGPIDLSSLNTNTYSVIRPYAELSCDASSNCPTIDDWSITWAGGITISGTIQQYDQATNVTSGNIAVAVNGVLQSGKVGTISAGAWSISNVTVFEGDVITVFVNGAADANEAVGVTRYDGQGDVSGMTLYERHVSLGSNDATTTPLTNIDVGAYDFTNTEDVFMDLTGSVLEVCGGGACVDAELYIQSGVYFEPGGKVVTHDIENNGTLTATTTIEVNGSWDNNATTTMTGSTVVFAATSTTESIDSTGALTSAFDNLFFGTTTGNASWTLPTTLDVNGDLTVSRGTLARGGTEITVAGDLTTEANGFWTGIATTTFDGGTSAAWSDANATLQNVGYVVVDGSSKIVTLSGNVAAQDLNIDTNDTLDASASNYDIRVYGDWNNQNNFIARSGEVFFAATSTGSTITTIGDAFYDLSFTGVGGGWSFTESTITASNNFTVATGTVTLPTATTTVGGSFDASAGTFAHNNGVLYFTSNNAETIIFDGGVFTNAAHNITFNGGGSWTFADTNATTSNDVRVTQGMANFPSGTLAIGGTLIDGGGVFAGGTGTVKFYSSATEVITAGGSSFNNIDFNGAGSWSFSDADVSATGDLLVTQGTLTMPSGTFSVAGSYDNNASVIATSGEILFNSTDSGETVAFGGSALYDVTFSGAGGGWTVVENATATNAFTIATSSDWTLSSGQVLSVAGVFTNNVGGASTTWTGSTLVLEAGAYSLNDKDVAGDVYETIDIAAGADIKTWNSVASTYNVDPAGSLYSRDHNAVDGDLYIWGSYENTAGNEYWSYATDFDGTDLTGGSERQVDVRLDAGANASLSSTTFEIVGDMTASTTIANQGAGNYTINISAGTTTANYYSFSDLGSTGVSFANSGVVTNLDYGEYGVTAVAGSAITLSSTTVDANPGLQIFNTVFSTSTAIAAFNVSQTDGTPVSYWWFRDGSGNLYGEAKDNDTGDPGSVRFDNSSLVMTVSGTVYSDGGVTPLVGGTCDGVTNVIRVVVENGSSYTGSCSNVDGTYSVGGVVIVGDPTITVYLDNASGGEKGSVITRTPTTDITELDIYANRVRVTHEDVSSATIANLAAYDFDDDSDLQFIASTSTNPDSLTVLAGNELFVASSSTFAPGGVVILSGNAEVNSYDGSLYVDDNATFDGIGTTTYTIGGRLVLGNEATFDAASSTVVMNATTTGKSITSAGEITFHDLMFNGVDGGWNLGADINVNGDMAITAGTVTGTADITLPNGSLTGNGVLSMGGGTTTIATSSTLGGTSAWSFYNLQLGDGLFAGTTTPVFTATTTISGRLTIATAHFLDAGSTEWDLAGTGTVFVENGTFQEDVSTVRYSGAGANVLSTQYYNLDINSGFGSQTYVATGLGMIVDNDLTLGGDAASSFDVNTNDSLLDINGDVVIRSNGTLSASDSGVFTIAGSYDNNGIFAGNGGLVEFDGAGVINVAAGANSFSNIEIDATGSVTVSENATSTGDWMLRNANTFTVSSGERLAVGGEFYNNEGGAATTWTGSTLYLFGGNNYSINPATTSDSYAALEVDGTTQIRMWSSDAATVTVDSTASLYSQDHANIDGDLYIWGSYQNSSADDYWDYAYDFDGTSLGGGSERKVDVYFEAGASATYTGGSLDVRGVATASTTIQNQGSGSYSLTLGGTASTSLKYYEIRDIDSNGLTMTGSPNVNELSYGDLEVSVNAGTAITLGGDVITNNPADNFTLNRFALNGVASGFNVTATGTSNSSWRFANHYGDIDGEGFDVDPDGDPGYVAWDDSAALITISGNVYSDEGTTALAACDGVTNNIHLRVAGITSYATNCNATTGAYSITNVSYGSSDSLVVYIDGETEKGAAVSKEPVSNISNLNIYQNRVIVRHENVNPIDIVDMSVWDSSDDPDIPFTAVDASPDTLTLPANTKLILWDNKEFEPGGDVIVTGGGAAAAYDGTLEFFAGASWSGQGTEALSIGGSMILGAGADYVSSNGTTTFTTTGAARTIDVNESAFNNVAFTGSGSWTIADTNATFDGDVTISAGTLTLPSGTSTFAGSFVNSGGSFDSNSGLALFTGVGTNGVTLSGSDLSTVEFAGGDYVFGDTNATSTGSTTITSGDITLPSGIFAVGGDFRNVGGSVTHNTSELVITNSSAATVLASSSDLYGVTFSGGGTYEFEDYSLTLLDSLFINSGAVTLASGTMSIGGSFDATGGSFYNATGTILFNSGDGGEFIDAGSSEFYSVQISAPAGGYSLLSGATTTNNFTISSANSFTLQSGAVLNVEGVFLNSVGGVNTTWTGSTLKLDGANTYSINTKSSGGDQYENLVVGAGSDLRMWNSGATATVIDSSSSLYSQDNGAVDGDLYIYGDFHVSTTTEYWSYATDFDGTNITGGSERAVTVYHAASATTTVDGGTLNLVGTTGNETTVTNQGAGTYAVEVNEGTFLAQYYAFRNLNTDGLNLSGTPVISSLAYGDYELAVNGGSLITLSSTTLNANASLVIAGNRFATTSAITGNNVTLTGLTSNAWTFTSHTGNLDGENYDVDGVSQCGSVRWSDSSCLLTQQVQYRWRNDDGGLGVPDSEWFNANWAARKRVSVVNVDTASYSNAAVQLFVDYDTDMQADFDDLRFTNSDGTTAISHWIGSTTDSVAAEVWVEIPTLTAEDTSIIYMYYNNPTATTTSSSTATFIASDDFEDNNLTEYSGQTSLFDTDTPFAFDGTYGLDNGGNETSRANLGGMYDNNQTVSQGETIRYMQYIDSTGTQDEVCTKFAIQGTNVPNDNYAVCTELNGTDLISLVQDVTEDVSAATALATSTATLSTGWYEFEIDWGTDDSITVEVTDPSGNSEATLSATDAAYTSGGFGFSFWFNKGGWDSFNSRPTLTTEPTYKFGAEQVDGGATWAAAEDTAATYDVADIARLRVMIENTGLAIANQQFLLEYAELGSSPSCEAVSPTDFASVPVQASCGTSPVCMQSSTNITNGAPTFDLLTASEVDFVAGEAREDPSNITGNIDMAQNEFTELEYVVTPTTNVVDQNICFRVTDNGADYDTYLSVAQMNVRFDPVVTNVILNEGNPISLLPGTTTTVYATGTVTDLNGYDDIVYATTTFYRGGVGAACIKNNNNCYVSSGSACQFTDCAGNSCTLECTADFYFHADPTDSGSLFDGQEWFAFVEVVDTADGFGSNTSIGQELNTLRALDSTGVIDYGTLEVNSDTGATNASTTIVNEGNAEINIEITGTDLSDGEASVIPANEQKFATSTFTYSSCGVLCDAVSSTTATELDVELTKPTSDTPPVEDDVFWGIYVPIGINSAPHSGYNVFTAISPS